MGADIGYYIGVLSNQLRRQTDSAASSRHFTGAQGRILHFLLAQPSDREVFQKDVELEFNLRCSTATQALKRMERDGLIRRESVPYDARLKRIVATQAGLSFREQVLADTEAIEAKIRRGLSQEQLEQFVCTAKQIIHNLSDGD